MSTNSLSFADLGLSTPILNSLETVGYEMPSAIQIEAIPHLLSGVDLIGQAQTGSGKTAAFGLPIIEQIDPEISGVQALVLTPTRELCIQVTQALRTYGKQKDVNVVALFGGAQIRSQQAQLQNGAQIAVGTVGRVLDLIKRRTLVLHDCRFVVLDEADEMLDLGFLEDVERILKYTPSGRQTALFSATMPPPIRKLADNYLYDPVVVKVAAKQLTVDSIAQFQFETTPKEKIEQLINILKSEQPDQAIVFVRTKTRCQQLDRDLRKKGLQTKALHGDLSQGVRDGVMLSFRDNRVPTLIATDVAARGIDVSNVTHVINYDIPTSPDIYVHRIGRTGRSGRSGRAITFVEPKQNKQIEVIEKHVGTTLEKWSSNSGQAKPRRVKAERHQKPSDIDKEKTTKDELFRCILNTGSRQGFVEADIINGIREAKKLQGTEIRNLLVLERFTFVTLPATSVAGLQTDSFPWRITPIRRLHSS